MTFRHKTTDIIGLVVSFVGVAAATATGLIMSEPMWALAVVWFLWRIKFYRDNLPFFAHEYIIHKPTKE